MCHEIIHISSGYQILRKVHIFVIYFPTLFIAACAAVKYFLSLPIQGSAPPHSNLLTIPAIVKKWCKIRKRSCSLNRKKAQKAKKQNCRTREMPYFQAFQPFRIVSISLLRCFHTPADIFLIDTLKFLSLKFEPKLMLGCIVSNYGTQAILRVQIDTNISWALSFLHLPQMP